jgi:hypothetical protein
MEKTCRSCKHFNTWAIVMAQLDDAPICRKLVWESNTVIELTDLEDKLNVAATCEHYEPRVKR